MKAELEAMCPQSKERQDFYKSPEARGGAWSRFSLQPSDGAHLPAHGPGTSASRTVRPFVSVVEASKLEVFCPCGPRQPTDPVEISVT